MLGGTLTAWPLRLVSRDSPTSVSVLVALGAKSDEILRCVIAQAAPRLEVMDLKIFRSPAALATPAVALRDLMPEFAVGFSVSLKRGRRDRIPLNGLPGRPRGVAPAAATEAQVPAARGPTAERPGCVCV
jgi:hypothetical protein